MHKSSMSPDMLLGLASALGLTAGAGYAGYATGKNQEAKHDLKNRAIAGSLGGGVAGLASNLFDDNPYTSLFTKLMRGAAGAATGGVVGIASKPVIDEVTRKTGEDKSIAFSIGVAKFCKQAGFTDEEKDRFISDCNRLTSGHARTG